MSERRHGHLLPLASTCMSTSLLPSVIYDFWCTCVFLRWRPPVWWSYILFCCVKVVEVPWFQRKIFPLPAWAPVWFQVCFIISDVRAFFLGGVLLWGGAKFYWAASRSTRGSSMAVEKHFPRTCMRISLFVFKCVLWYLMFVRFFFRWRPPVWWSQMRLRCVESTCAASSRH